MKFADAAADPTDDLRSIPQLVAEAKAAGRAPHYAGLIARSLNDSISGLLAIGRTSDDPLTQWIIHLQLRRRGVPPCLRWEVRPVSREAVFVAFVADLAWLVREHPSHRTEYARWRGLFDQPIGERWHRVALWVFRGGRNGAGGGYYFTKGLGLTAEQTQPLATMSSNRQRGNRRLINALAVHRAAIFNRVVARPDKAAMHTPSEVADRRAELLRLYLLADRDATRAARYWELLHGSRISRQALSRHLEHIELATGLRLRDSRSMYSACRPSVGLSPISRQPA